MKSWKISKLRIQAFKAFAFVDFNFESCSLLTLEGPNGYGKTSVFDAIELLLTGKISRINDLYQVVMPAAKKLYKDNLYWNVKEGEKAIEIRAEIVSGDGDCVCFVRVASVEDLKLPINNKADRFDIFKLFSIKSFDSIDLGPELGSEFLDGFFGDGFAKNYSMLNYLQQGQSTFIFSKRITERKNALEDLLKTREARDQIDLCVRAEKRLGLVTSAVEQQQIADLQRQVSSLQNVDLVAEHGEYQKFSTREPAPIWDAVEPFARLNDDQFGVFIAQLDLLLEVYKFKGEIHVRTRNSDIERYIAEKEHLFGVAVSIGKSLASYSELRAQQQRLTVLGKGQAALVRSPLTVTAADLDVVRLTGASISDDVAQLISRRDELSKLLSGRSSKIVELNKLRLDLQDKHQHVFGDANANCSLCGANWETNEKLRQALADTTKIYEREIGELSGQLNSVHQSISTLLDPIKNLIHAELQDLEGKFNRPLYAELAKNVNNFEEINRLNERLQALSIEYSPVFSVDVIEIADRKERLIEQVRALKQTEGAAPPSGWEQAITDTFATINDFYSAEPSSIVAKKIYVTGRHRQQQNATLQDARRQLASRQQAFNAAIAAKEKISQLKGILTAVERDYSARVISNIELIFHIYSGRLIQNYQRGLGLFIDYGDGKQLQFSTAEQSAHDATLSMSSGQLSALSLAFFLSLNRVYAECAFVLIDDPAQSLDEINIASLTDLLRCELGDRQLVISSHEDNIAGYVRYRFNRAGLSQKPFHMQSHIETSQAL